MARKRRRRKGGSKRWIGKATRSMERRGTKGSFRAWCERRGYSKVTSACIAAGLRSKSAAIRKKAAFAKGAASARK